jgi:glycosyltransferase involved in cell wall biosynthesis
VSITRYLEKHGKAATLPVSRLFRYAVVIPAMAESESLPHTLRSLSANSALMLEDTLTLVVVNSKPDAPEAIRADNETVVKLLLDNSWGLPNLHYLNMTTDAGVGGARKAGMDTALQYLDHSCNPLILCLDADTLVEPNYLKAVAQLRRQPAAIVKFRHQLPSDPVLRRAIMEYELFMRYYVLGLHWAGSPYAFHSLGSAIICRAADYVRCGGMRERNGGEDFYFLQSLRKLGPVGYIGDTTIYPAGRLSDRVDFGTGPRLRKLMNGEKQDFYHFGIFIELKKMIDLVAAGPGLELPETLKQAVRPEAWAFLEEQNFAVAWEKIFRNTPRTTEALQRAFHTWLDGFRTLKLAHHLERCVPMLGRIDYRQAAERLFEYYGKRGVDSFGLENILEEFRRLDDR